MEFFPERTPEESMTQGKANTYEQLFSEHGNQLEVVASFIPKVLPAQNLVM